MRRKRAPRFCLAATLLSARATGSRRRCWPMSIIREESFGPIIGIQAVADDDAAVDQMNDTDYGLTAGVYTANEKRAKKILARVNAGSVYWNCCDRVSPRLPWSGVKHSGIGLTLSTYGIQTFTRTKAWHLRGA